jgi:hypothetical protein
MSGNEIESTNSSLVPDWDPGIDAVVDRMGAGELGWEDVPAGLWRQVIESIHDRMSPAEPGVVCRRSYPPGSENSNSQHE